MASDIAPLPNIDGIMGRDNRENTQWITEIHRNGYVSVLFRNIEKTAALDKGIEPKIGKIPDGPLLHTGYSQLFQAYCDFLSELWTVTETDLPYVISCTYFKAKGTIFMIKNLFRTFSVPYTKDEIRFPFHYRQIGQDPGEIAKMFCEEMFNAFGLENSI